ncbi:alpha-2-macroglobulin family protein [Botrimarina hoheduenensis]|uniref:Alpha-2-macroglobulin family protein n=1 Tax=Botrimarina hoheduenensis TaxID=2528000 RepID=A0A5C5VXM2_9BACT|nr:alpha-2-macroglobulin family protein [Botrimarina hoheduenensis]TWT42745.1 Alpha-2-macroglobulin family protein [Botrimarina hoheduenensis]
MSIFSLFLQRLLPALGTANRRTGQVVFPLVVLVTLGVIGPVRAADPLPSVAITLNESLPSSPAVAAAMTEGYWEEALQQAQQRLEVGDADATDLSAALSCLSELNRIDQADALIEAAVERYATNPALLLAAARGYRALPAYGVLLREVFQRGTWRGGDRSVNAAARDRVRILQLLTRALRLSDSQADLRAEIARELASNVFPQSYSRGAPPLQLLTDLESLPPLDRQNEETLTPLLLKEDGTLVLHEIPESWEAARTDGERWRWALAEWGRLDPDGPADAELAYAEFLQEFLGIGAFNNDYPEDDAFVTDLSMLGDDEVIADVGQGAKRYALPEGHRFMSRMAKYGAWQSLAEEYLNRCQRGRAADVLRTALAEVPLQTAEKSANDFDAELAAEQLDQIIRPWARTSAWGETRHVAGEAPRLRIEHRNTERIDFTARRIAVDTLLDDLEKALEASDGESAERLQMLEGLGWEMLQTEAAKYLGPLLAEWSTPTPRAADHGDTATVVSVPLPEAGVYLVTGRPAGGSEFQQIVRVVDTALVRKPAAEGMVLGVLDARDGSPVTDATVRLFGYRSRYGKERTKPRIETLRDEAKIDASGWVGVFLKPAAADEEPMQWLCRARGTDGRSAYLGFERLWRRQPAEGLPNATRTYVVTDRPVYRPEATVKFKAWIARPDYSKPPTEASNEFAHQAFEVEITDPQGEQVWQGLLTATTYGGLAGEFTPAAGSPLGVYRIQIVGFGGGAFRVEEYRKPEFEVTVEGPAEAVRWNEPFEAVIGADYYFGDPVAGASVTYRVERRVKSGSPLPPAPWDWLYGRGYGWLAEDAPWYPQWGRWGCPAPLPEWNTPGWSAPATTVLSGTGRLDASGRLRLSIETDGDDQDLAPSVPGYEYTVSVEVTDASRRTQSATGKVLVSKQPAVTTVWLARGFYSVGETINATSQVRLPDGKAVGGAGRFVLYKVTRSERSDQDPADKLTTLEETEVQAWDTPTDLQGAASLKLKASEPGRYRLVYQCRAIDGAEVTGGVLFSILGPGYDGDGFRYNAVEIVPDQPTYAVGDTARLLISTDAPNSTVALFLRAEQSSYAPPQVIRIPGKSYVFELPITAADQPNIFVEAVTIAEGRMHTAVKQIVVPPAPRVLDVEVVPSADAYLPGQEGTLRVRLTDAQGVPIVGEATVAVYDRSVDALAGAASAGDFVKRFWQWRRSHSPAGAASLESPGSYPIQLPDSLTMGYLGVFDDLLLADPGDRILGRGVRWGGGAGAISEVADMAIGMPMATRAMAKSEPAGEKPTLRTNFADTALWVGAVVTDADGFAVLPITLPESLTAWRVRVWAISDGVRVGEGSAEVVTRKDLMVRLQMPRQLVEGDTATLSAVVHNKLTTPQSVTVWLEAAGESLKLPSDARRVVPIPAGAEQRIDWTVQASTAGETPVQVFAEARPNPEADLVASDGVQLPLTVLVHGSLRTETFSATLGPDQRQATLELVVPEKRRVETTRLELRYTPTLVGAMLDALPYLIEYPHGCTEQTLNRFLPAVITRRTVEQLGVDLAERAGADRLVGPPDGVRQSVNNLREVDRLVAEGLRRLEEMQLSNGGWGWFSGLTERSTAHTTAVVVRGLIAARASGVAVAEPMLDRGIAWLNAHRSVELSARDNYGPEGKPNDPDSPSKPYADDLDALVHLTLAEAGQHNEAMRERLFTDRLKLAVYGRAMLGLALHAEANSSAAANNPRPAMLRDRVLRNLRQYVAVDDENQTARLNLPDDNWWRWYGSEYETHAMFLRLLAATEPLGETASRIVKHLVDARLDGARWNSTRDTALVIEALSEYALASGQAAAEGEYEVWLDGRKRDQTRVESGEALRFDGRFVLRGEELDSGRHTLELRKRDAGRLYAGASLSYFSLEPDLRAAGLEVRIERRLYLLQDALADEAAPRRVATPHRGVAPSGAVFEVELIVTSKNDYEYVVIEDPRAAGFEAVDTRSGYLGAGLGAYAEYRDAGARFYVRSLPRGEHALRYRLRAESPGVYAALPATVTGMYAPRLRGNSDENRWEIVDRSAKP